MIGKYVLSERKKMENDYRLLWEELLERCNVGCVTSLSVGVCESDQVTSGTVRGVSTSFFPLLCYRFRFKNIIYLRP